MFPLFARHPSFLSLALAALCGVCSCAVAQDYHVSPQGNDGHDGSAARPFATVGRAMEAVRALRVREQAGPPVNVYLRGGTHEIREILAFGPEDSGTAARPVTYRSYPGERAVLSGGRRLEGTWRQTPGRAYWQLAVPPGERFFSLFVDGQSRTRARHPNWDQKVLRAEGRAAGQHPRETFRYAPGDIDPGWSHPNDIDIVLLCSWTPTLHRVGKIDADSRVVHFTRSQAWWEPDHWNRRFRYYLSNVFEALDDPGEWYLDYHAGRLYYYPMPGEDPNALEFVAPVMRSRMIEIQGNLAAGACVEHLHFRDLDIRHLDGDMDKHDGMYRQGHMYLTSAVVARGLRHASFVNCTLAQLGEYAMELAEGCRDVRVQQCHIWDLGAGALQLGATSLKALLAPVVAIDKDDIVLEAGQAQVAAPMVAETDGTAAGEACVVLPKGHQGGSATFAVDLPAAGEYGLLARVIAPSGEADSFTIQVNDGPRYTYDTGTGANWFVSTVRGRELDGKPVKAALARGRNTITVFGREPGARLDRLILRPFATIASTDALATNEVLDLVIDNNCIHRLGTIWHGCYGIVNRFASRTRITHNEMFDIHWDAVGLDARWNWKGEKYSHGNVVAYNHFHHLGLRYQTDAAGVYQFGPLDTHIHHNLIHDTVAYPYVCGYAGIYLDEQSRGALVESNLVYNVDWTAYFQHWGQDNTFRNNIGAFARDGLIRRGGLNRLKANHFDAYRNLYVADNEIAIRSAWQEGERPTRLRQHMYHTTAPNTALTFAGKTFAEWQATGQDEGSLVGDPGFRDPANFDFALKPDSPAVREIAFVPFDEEIAKAGLYGDPEWRRIGSRQTRRQPAPAWTAEDLAKLVSFATDLEAMAAGEQLPGFHLGTSGEATFAVTDEAGLSGTRSLKCTDHRGLAKPFYPYIHMAPKGMDKGSVTFAFAAMLHAGTPAPFYLEFRGAGSTAQVGPSLHFSADGKVTANDREVLVAPPGTWTEVEISFRLGENAPKTYDLMLRHSGKTQKLTLPFQHETFADVRWIGFSAYADVDGAFYLDDTRLAFE